MEPNYYNRRGGLNANLTKLNGKPMAEKHPEEYKRCIQFSETVTEYKKGKRFLPVTFAQRLQWFLDQRISRCENCDNVCDPNNKFCSAKCSRSHPDTVDKIGQTRKKKYGSYHSDKHTADYGFVTAEGRRKAVETKLESGQYLDYEKSKRTMIDRHGDVNYNVTRSRQTLKEKYGVDNPYQIDSVREKISKSQSKNNSVGQHLDKRVFDDQFVYNYLSKHGRHKFLNKFNCSVTFLRRREVECGYRELKKSVGEIEICKFLDSLGVEYETNTRQIIKPLELDVYIPSLKIGIEFDGVYWHSASDHDSYIHQKDRHIAKEAMCNELGIQLFRIREDQWIYKMDIWKSMLASKINRQSFTRVYARKCVVKEIDSKTSREFVDENHIQGYTRCSKSLGLFFGDELVSVITLGKPRFDNEYDYEIIRFCSKKYYSVVGGFSKLLKRVNGSVMSYANKAWSIGGVYESSGLEFDSETDIGIAWVKDDVVYNRLRLQKHKLPDILDDYDETKTGEQNLYDNGYRKLPISGNIKYVRK